MMKLGLISTFVESSDNPSPPLGLASIATYLKEYMNFENTRIIDNTFDDVIKTTKKFNPDIVGISAMTIHYNDAIDFARKIKEVLDIPILMGGVHITTLPSSFSNVFDVAILGEGEQTMLELMNIFEKYGEFPSNRLKNTDGIGYYDKDKFIMTKRRKLIEPLDRIPIIDKDFLNKEYFKPMWLSWNETKGRQMLIMTARGCPYRCVFCSTSVFWQKVRFHRPEHICNEIMGLMEKYNVDHIAIADDLFTLNKNRLKELIGLFKQHCIKDKIAIFCQARTNLIDDEMCKLLKELNVKALNFGFESGSERILNYLKKGTVTIKDNKNAVVLANKYGFKIEGSFIFGSPHETMEDMRKTIDFIDFIRNNTTKADIWHFVMTPFPGTEIWEIAKMRGKVSDDMDWSKLSHYNLDDPMLLDSSVDKKEFKKLFLEVKAKTDQIKINRHWLMSKLRHDMLRLIKKVASDPGRLIRFFVKYQK